MKAKAVVRLKFPSEKHLEIVYDALEPEIKKPATMRSRANVEMHGSHLLLAVEAMDTVALRAALNAYLRWVNSMMNVLEVLDSEC